MLVYRCNKRSVAIVVILSIFICTVTMAMAKKGNWKKKKVLTSPPPQVANDRRRHPVWASDSGINAICNGILAGTPAYPVSKHSRSSIGSHRLLPPKQHRIDKAFRGERRLSHCAVVGSSSVAKYCDWASDIEEIPYVIRSNLQPAPMYPDVVGSHTEIQLRYSIRKDKNLGHCSFTYSDRHLNTTRHVNMCTGEGGAWLTSVHNNRFEDRVAIQSAVDSVHLRYVYTDKSSRLASNCATHYGSVGSEASSGIRAVLFALLLCKRVEVFNFWAYDHVTLGGIDYDLPYSFYTETGHGNSPIRTNPDTGAWVGAHKFSDELNYIEEIARTPGINLIVHKPNDTRCSAAIAKSRPKSVFSRP